MYKHTYICGCMHICFCEGPAALQGDDVSLGSWSEFVSSLPIDCGKSIKQNNGDLLIIMHYYEFQIQS